MPINKDNYPNYSDQAERLTLRGSFAPNGASAVSAASNKGDRHWSVAWISTGLFRVTFTQDFAFSAAQLIYADAHLQLASAGDQWAQCGAYVEADRTLDIRVMDASGAAVADIAANANNRINFEIEVRTSTLHP